MVLPSLSKILVDLDSHWLMWYSVSVYKVYTTMSGRRFMSDIREAETKELVTKSPSFASNARLSGKSRIDSTSENPD